MGIITLLILVTVAAVVFASLFVAHSNYLDTNINKDLNVMKYLGIKIDMPEGMRKQINDCLIPKLSIFTRLGIINSETTRLNNHPFASPTLNNPLACSGVVDTSSPP